MPSWWNKEPESYAYAGLLSALAIVLIMLVAVLMLLLFAPGERVSCYEDETTVEFEGGTYCAAIDDLRRP